MCMVVVSIHTSLQGTSTNTSDEYKYFVEHLTQSVFLKLMGSMQVDVYRRAAYTHAEPQLEVL